MGNPVVHFEITGPDRAALEAFYGDLFGWRIQPVPEMDYALVDTDSGGDGIAGGLGGSTDGAPAVRVYLQVPDIDAHLARIEAAGGTVLMGRQESPQVTLAMFRDPQGNVVGLVEG